MLTTRDVVCAHAGSSSCLAEALLLVFGGLGGLLLGLLLSRGLARVLCLLGLPGVSEMGGVSDRRLPRSCACRACVRARYQSRSCAWHYRAQGVSWLCSVLGGAARSLGLLLLIVVTLRGHLEVVLPGRNGSSTTQSCGGDVPRREPRGTLTTQGRRLAVAELTGNSMKARRDSSTRNGPIGTLVCIVVES